MFQAFFSVWKLQPSCWTHQRWVCRRYYCCSEFLDSLLWLTSIWSLLSPLYPHRYLDLLPLILYLPLSSPSVLLLSLFPPSHFTIAVQDSLASCCDGCLSVDSTAEESLLSSIISFTTSAIPLFLSCLLLLHHLDNISSSSSIPFLQSLSNDFKTAEDDHPWRITLLISIIIKKPLKSLLSLVSCSMFWWMFSVALP